MQTAPVGSGEIRREMLTMAEAARYLGYSVSYLRKLTMKRRIRYYKPNFTIGESGKVGGRVFFDIADLNAYMRGVEIAPREAIREQVSDHVMQHGGVI